MKTSFIKQASQKQASQGKMWSLYDYMMQGSIEMQEHPKGYSG